MWYKSRPELLFCSSYLKSNWLIFCAQLGVWWGSGLILFSARKWLWKFNQWINIQNERSDSILKKVKSLSCVQLFATPWTVAYQALPSMGFSRQEYWSGLPFPSPEDLPDLGIEPRSPALQADALPSEPPGKLNSISKDF